MSHYDDVLVSEAANSLEFNALMAARPYHLVFFSWRVAGLEWAEFFAAAKHGSPAHFVLLTPNDSKSYVREAEKLGVVERLLVPAHHKDVSELVDRLSGPSALRAAKRYNIPGSSVLVGQHDGQFAGSMVNVSLGGVLCELEFSALFNWAAPAVVTLDFGGGGPDRMLTMPAALVRLHVIESLPDLTPARTRIAYRFMPMAADQGKLTAILRQAESLQELANG